MFVSTDQHKGVSKWRKGWCCYLHEQNLFSWWRLDPITGRQQLEPIVTNLDQVIDVDVSRTIVQITMRKRRGEQRKVSTKHKSGTGSNMTLLLKATREDLAQTEIRVNTKLWWYCYRKIFQQFNKRNEKSRRARGNLGMHQRVRSRRKPGN